MKKRIKVSLEQLYKIQPSLSPDKAVFTETTAEGIERRKLAQSELVRLWNKATRKKREEWISLAAWLRQAGRQVPLREFLRECQRKIVLTREVIMFANFEFHISKVEDTAHGGWRFVLNEYEYLQYLRYGRSYPRGKQFHLSKEERRVASPPIDKVVEPVPVFQGDELLWVGIADERAELPMEMSAQKYLFWKLPQSTEPRLVPKISYRCNLDPYHGGSTKVSLDTFLQFQGYIRDALKMIAANPEARLPLSPFVPKEETERQDSPWRSRFPKDRTYCHYMLQDLQVIRQTEDAHKVRQCGCGNFFLQHTPKQRFCQPRCGGRARIDKLRRKSRP